MNHIETIARGVCVIDGKVLLCLPKDRSYAYLPGGHIEFGETGREALVREMKEETGLDATAGELLGVIESSFVQKGEKHCEINLVYEMEIGKVRGEGEGEDEVIANSRRRGVSPRQDKDENIPFQTRRDAASTMGGGVSFQTRRDAASTDCPEVSSQEDWICFDWCALEALDTVNLLPPESKDYCHHCSTSNLQPSTFTTPSTSHLQPPTSSSHLHIIATPIGNLGDLSPRAIEAFKSAAVIACEDTRRTWQLLTHFGIPRPAEMFSYRQGNEERITERVLGFLAAGKEVVLCSDGGYPAISDPGYRLVRACAQQGIAYDVIPGASAVNVALLMSGLSTSSFVFRGFPPRGPGALRNWFAEDAEKEHTLICYESPFRIAATLKAAFDALGDREAAVCIELTKLHERVSRGYLSDLVKEYEGAKVKGEVALVIAGNNPKFLRFK